MNIEVGPSSSAPDVSGAEAPSVGSVAVVSGAGSERRRSRMTPCWRTSAMVLARVLARSSRSPSGTRNGSESGAVVLVSGMASRTRRNRDLVRPGKPGSGALHRRTAWAMRQGWGQQLRGSSRLLGYDAVAEGGELSWPSEPWGGGDPAGFQALHPLHEVGTEPSVRPRR